MAIQNEVFKFVAELELDEKTKNEFTKGLKDANARCDALRKSIVDQQKELLKLAAAGKEGSKAYQDLEASLKANRDALKGSQEMANKYASALGVNQMSMNQLKAYTKKLRNEMNSLHKESNPDLWNKYNNKLKEAEIRMKELKGGIKETGGVMNLLQSKWAQVLGGSKIVGEILSKVYSGIGSIAKETQMWGGISGSNPVRVRVSPTAPQRKEENRKVFLFFIVRQKGRRPGSHIVQPSCLGGLAMANEIQVLPLADPSLLNVLNLAHQTHRALQNWQAQHPNDVFFRLHWDDIDNLDTGIVDIKCKIADLIAYSLVDHLQ